MAQTSRNTKFINASANIIYQAFANPTAMEAWLAPGDMTGKLHHFDWREGGGYEMSLFYPAGEKERQGKTAATEDRFTARIVTLKPAKQITQAIRFHSPDPRFAGEMIMETVFEPKAGGTDIIFTFKNIPVGIRPEDNEEGTRLTLEKLARYVEHGDTKMHRQREIDEQDSDGSANAFEEK
jgi:uncharacterized protein YndB with AHSA1/START domain